MIEIAAAVQIAGAAYNTIKKSVEAGREAQDMIGAFGKFFDSMDSVSEASIQNQSSSTFSKLFRSSSVEAQALEITAAKYKIAFMEKQLREFLIYSGQADFYEDMLDERKRLRRHRQAVARRKAESKAFWIDVSAFFGIFSLSAVVIFSILAITI